MIGVRSWAAITIAVAACGGSSDAPVDAELGMHTLSGVVRYEDRAQQSNGRLSTTITPLPARAVSLSLIAEDDGEVLGTTITDDQGGYSFSFEFIAGPSEPVHLLAAAMNMGPERPVRVVRLNNQVHGFGGEAFGLHEAAVDLLITESSGAAEAFNVFDQLVRNADYVRGPLGLTPRQLTAVWEKGSDDGTYYSGDSTMHLLGEAADDDGYDDTVILHEAGHFIEDVVGRSDSPGGFHDGSPTDPNLAWSEGFSTYWAMALLGEPFYGDSNAGGGWGYNADRTVTRAPQPAGPIGQDVGENLTTEVLWDIGDGAAGDDDPHAGEHLSALRIQPTYLRTTTLRQVGEPGVDLVDFLDGYFVAAGLTACAAVRTIVVTTHTFPYDFAGPAGPCP